MADQRSKQRFDWLLVLALAISLAGNVFLMGRLSAQRSAVASTAQKQPDVPQVGDILPAIQVADLSGKLVTIDYGSFDSTVIYVFSKSCVWCERNARNAEALGLHVSDSRRFVALATAPLSAEDAAEKGLKPSWVVHPLSSLALREARLTVTPATLVVDRAGRISRVWMGAYTAVTKSAIEEFFGLSLPMTIGVE